MCLPGDMDCKSALEKVKENFKTGKITRVHF